MVEEGGVLHHVKREGELSRTRKRPGRIYPGEMSGSRSTLRIFIDLFRHIFHYLLSLSLVAKLLTLSIYNVSVVYF